MQKLVLDLGCGEGRSPEVSWRELEYDDHFRVGTDLNIEKLKKIKTMSMDVILFNLEDKFLPFRDGVFDLVIAQDIFEHISSHIYIRDEVYRVLKSGGKLYVKVPCETSPNLWKDYTHRRGYTEESIKQFLQDGNFAILKFEKRTRAHILTKDLIHAIKSLLLILISKIVDHDHTTIAFYVLCQK